MSELKEHLPTTLRRLAETIVVFDKACASFYRSSSFSRLFQTVEEDDGISIVVELEHCVLDFREIVMKYDLDFHPAAYYRGFPGPGVKDLINAAPPHHNLLETRSLHTVSQASDVTSPEVAALSHDVANAPQASSDTYNTFTSSSDPRIWKLLETVLSDRTQEPMILNLPGNDSQYMLDAVQEITDSPQRQLPLSSLSLFNDNPRTIHRYLRRLLLRLALACDKLPTVLFISRVKCSPHSVAMGGGADIFTGTYNEIAVALKRLRLFLMMEQAKVLEMTRAFFHECLLWRNLHHKHILPFFGINKELFHGTPCMVMPWMENGNVRHAVSSLVSEDPESQQELQRKVHKWLQHMASGLAYLHEEGVAHGDLRGVNVLLDSNWNAQLADFGLAVFADGVSHNYGSLRGGAARWLSPELLDPEQFGLESSRPTYASDVYSYACVCIELYTSDAPFHELLEATAMLRVLSGRRPPRPSFLGGKQDVSKMPDALWSLIERCWAQDADQRPLASHLLDLVESA
ncbi:hypothetical protein EIP91_007939 [Steccherinum ochraceum]|uniref:Protein kinase domain-containing protein n=1 Tax=Steccherinum ochraceum TaxID=92696 RepID=A0A4R0R9A4_9APHY|nr:hypothetical protein EIP91_007939 [Steccherinum ochraceum]